MAKSKVWLGGDGILRSEYPHSTHVSLEDIKYELEQRIAITKEKHPLIVILHGLVEFNSDAQEFLFSQEHSEVTKIVAIVISEQDDYPILSKYLIDTFLTRGTLPFPVQVFDNESSAIYWINHFLKK